MRVFFDTNVWYSALVSNGLCEALLTRVPTDHTLLSSALVWDELSAVLVRKAAAHPLVVQRSRVVFETAALIDDVTEPPDDSDARLVSAARAARSDLFVTGDTRVLGWDASNGMRIVKPREAWLILYPITA